MRLSTVSVILAAVILFEGYAVSVALPMGKTEDSSLEQYAFTSLLSDKGIENSISDADLDAAGKTKGSRVIVVADPSLWKNLQALNNGLSLIRKRADDNQVFEHRGASQDLSIPILRRDTMRCMVGRVYRPCWEV